MKKLISAILLFCTAFQINTFSQDQVYQLEKTAPQEINKSRFNINTNLSLGGGKSEMSWLIVEKAPGLEQSGTVGRTYRSNLSEINLEVKLTYAIKNIYVGGVVGLGRLKSSNDESIYLNDNGVITQRIDEDQLFPKSRTFYGVVIGYDIPLKKNRIYLSPEYNFVFFNLGPDRAFFRTDQFSDNTKNYNEAFDDRKTNRFSLSLKLKANDKSFFTVGILHQRMNYVFADDYLKEEISDFSLDESVSSLTVGYQIFF